MPKQTIVARPKSGKPVSSQKELIAIGKFTADDTGLNLPARMTWEEWKSLAPIFRDINLLNQSIQWAIGDYLAYGERAFCEIDPETRRLKQTPAAARYNAIIEQLHVEIHTLENWCSIALHIPHAIRRPPARLSFSHHGPVAAVAPDQQEKWLALAEKNNWTVSELRQAIYAEENHRNPNLPGFEKPPRLLSVIGEFQREFNLLRNTRPIPDWPREQKTAVRKALEEQRQFIDEVIPQLA